MMMFNGRPAKPWGSFREGAANLDMVVSHGRISKATRVIMLASFSLMAMTRMEVAVADPIVSRCCKSRARHERRCNTKSAIRSTATRMTRHQIPAALYAPLRVVLYENTAGGAIFEYDKPSTLQLDPQLARP
jgi:hypothetical protein